MNDADARKRSNTAGATRRSCRYATTPSAPRGPGRASSSRREVRPRGLMIGPRDPSAISCGSISGRVDQGRHYTVKSLRDCEGAALGRRLLKRVECQVELERCFTWSAGLAQAGQSMHMSHVRPRPCWNKRLTRLPWKIPDSSM